MLSKQTCWCLTALLLLGAVLVQLKGWDWVSEGFAMGKRGKKGGKGGKGGRGGQRADKGASGPLHAPNSRKNQRTRHHHHHHHHNNNNWYDRYDRPFGYWSNFIDPPGMFGYYPPGYYPSAYVSQNVNINTLLFNKNVTYIASVDTV